MRKQETIAKTPCKNHLYKLKNDKCRMLKSKKNFVDWFFSELRFACSLNCQRFIFYYFVIIHINIIMDDDLYDDEGPPPQLVEMPSTISPLRKVPVTVSRINLSIHSVLVYNQCSISNIFETGQTFRTIKQLTSYFLKK